MRSLLPESNDLVVRPKLMPDSDLIKFPHHLRLAAKDMTYLLQNLLRSKILKCLSVLEETHFDSILIKAYLRLDPCREVPTFSLIFHTLWTHIEKIFLFNQTIKISKDDAANDLLHKFPHEQGPNYFIKRSQRHLLTAIENNWSVAQPLLPAIP